MYSIRFEKLFSLDSSFFPILLLHNAYANCACKLIFCTALMINNFIPFQVHSNFTFETYAYSKYKKLDFAILSYFYVLGSPAFIYAIFMEMYAHMSVSV